MSKVRWIVRWVLIGILAYLGCVFIYAYFAAGVTKANYRRIDTHMSKVEIHALLGGESNGPESEMPIGNGSMQEWWYGSEGGLWLIFDEKDRIIWKEWDDRFRRQSFLERLFNAPTIRE